MKNVLVLIMIVASATIFSCGETKPISEMNKEKATAASVLSADKIVYTLHGPTVAPVYNRGYTITLTADSLLVTIKSYSKVLLTKTYPFSQAQFAKLLTNFEGITSTATDPTNRTVGGSTGYIEFYKEEGLIFKGSDWGGNAKDYAGVAAIDLSYLISDMDELVESTRKKNP